MSRLSAELIESFPCKTTYEDEDYRRIIEMLTDEYRYLETDMNGKYEDMDRVLYHVGSSDLRRPSRLMRLEPGGAGLSALEKAHRRSVSHRTVCGDGDECFYGSIQIIPTMLSKPAT